MNTESDGARDHVATQTAQRQRHHPQAPTPRTRGKPLGETREATSEVHELLSGLLRRLDGPTSEALLRAVHHELDSREAQAYASGWQDAMDTLDRSTT